ncbi:hypothetical protein E4U48_006554 [Claviceps purpurea]|nr:hypothetical protein E4U36_007427 [Claviceps purpurea]KAG6263726.1 hypothetical protein E4U48_006554 [Claviceps purpurea]
MAASQWIKGSLHAAPHGPKSIKASSRNKPLSTSLQKERAYKAPVSAVAISEPIPGLFVPSWDVAIEPGQEDKTVVNGTVQHLDTYMEANYPGWSAKWANFTSKSAPAKRATAARPTRPDMIKVKSVMCDHPLPGGGERPEASRGPF